MFPQIKKIFKIRNNKIFQLTIKQTSKAYIRFTLEKIFSAAKLLTVQNNSLIGLLNFVIKLGQIPSNLLLNPIESAASLDLSEAIRKRKKSDKLISLVKSYLKKVVLIALLGISLGPNYTKCILKVLYGLKWVEDGADSILSLYCFVLLTQSSSVILNILFSLMADKNDLFHHNKFLCVQCAISIFGYYFIYNFIGIKVEIVYIILNDISNILYTLNRLKKHFSVSLFGLLRDLVPRWKSIGVLIAGNLITNISFNKLGVDDVYQESYFYVCFVPHCLVGGFCGFVALFVLYDEIKSGK